MSEVSQSARDAAADYFNSRGEYKLAERARLAGGNLAYAFAAAEAQGRAEAVATERERCAVIVEQHGSAFHGATNRLVAAIATAIRASDGGGA